jgi:uncharacterized BrkB/YihY/UPF0761 family membrane protein
MLRMFPGPGRRDPLRTRARGILTVAVLLAAMLGAVMLIVVVPLAIEWLDTRCRSVALLLDEPVVNQVCSVDLSGVGGLVGLAATIVIAGGAALVTYVVVPVRGPSLRQAAWPAALVGVVVGSLTWLFGSIAAVVLGQWLALGIVGSVFLALIWLDLVSRALLYGAALARLRRDRDRLTLGPPMI